MLNTPPPPPKPTPPPPPPPSPPSTPQPPMKIDWTTSNAINNMVFLRELAGQRSSQLWVSFCFSCPVLLVVACFLWHYEPPLVADKLCKLRKICPVFTFQCLCGLMGPNMYWKFNLSGSEWLGGNGHENLGGLEGRFERNEIFSRNLTTKKIMRTKWMVHTVIITDVETWKRVVAWRRKH